MASELRSKYLAIKTSLEAIPDPQKVVDYIKRPKTQGGLGQPDAAICWANHPAETGGHPHTHYVVRFPSQAYWGGIRTELKNMGDNHAYSDVGRSWSRAVRYLLHLDNPEKEPIPRENFHFEGLAKEEVEIILGAPRQSLFNDIRNPVVVRRSPFELVNWLVNERGHSPGEVCSMLRCVMAASEYVARLQELESLRSDLPSPDELESFAELPQAIGGDPVGGEDFDLSGLPPEWA